MIKAYRPPDQTWFHYIIENEGGKLSCVKNWHIIFESLKWQVEHFNKLTLEERNKLADLNARQGTKLKELASKCNKKERCETGKQVSGIKLSQRLLLQLIYKCHCVGSCPDETFLAKHILPNNIGVSQLPEQAIRVDKLREENGWERPPVQTFFLGASGMTYNRDPNNEEVCVFSKAAERYLCTKQDKGHWKCDHIGQQIARHKTFGGHYINIKGDLIDSGIDDSIDFDIDDSINSETDNEDSNAE